MIYLVLAAVFVLGHFVVFALCRAAARGDQMGAITRREGL